MSADGQRCALVLNPAKVEHPHRLQAAVSQRAQALGWAEPVVLETTPADPGKEAAGQALAEGADLVLVAGGDGTVRAVIDGLAGSGVPLALLPAGTGNLLARNLDLPLDLDAALDVAFHGDDRRIDVGVAEGRRFAVMAGMGFAADMMADAPAGLKAALGWPAYLVSGARHLLRPGFEVSVRVDGLDAVRGRARTVLVGNVGQLQGGVRVLPDARPDDGRLDVAVVAPRNLREWLALVAHGLRRRHPADGDRRLRLLAGRRVEIHTRRPQRRQLDGEGIDDGSTLEAAVEPAALVVRVPRPEEAPQ